MRCFFVILDGIGDRGFDTFDGKTPLFVASTPNLDRLASLGANGLYHPSKIGLSLPSELAHFLMFGYEQNDFPGRGIIEAIGAGISVEKDEVALLAKLVSVKEQNRKLIVVDEKPSISYDFLKSLIQPIESIKIEGISFRFHLVNGLSGILVLSGDVSRHITDSNPVFEGYPLLKVKPLKRYGKDYATEKTAAALNKYLLKVYEILSTHPVNQRLGVKNPINAITTQRAGQFKSLPGFKEKWGLKAISISSASVYAGLAKLIGMDAVLAESIGNPKEDLLQKFILAQKLKGYEFIHIHTKAADEAGHTKNPVFKKDVIESLDGAFDFLIHEVLAKKDDLIVVTADHSTPSCGKMIHSGEALPVVFAGPGVRVDDVVTFNEISCAKGSMGLIRGAELMYMILNLMDRGRLIGLSDCEEPPLYFPGRYEPLSKEN